MKHIAALLVALFGLTACENMLKPSPYEPPPINYGPATERQVQAALQRFSALMAAQNASAIAEVYAPDGVWERASGPLRGRDAIRNALEGQSGVKVQSFDMTIAYMSYNGPAIVQTGDFTQVVRLPDGKVVNNQGRFEATWIRAANGDWWIRRMAFRPK